MIRFIAAFGIFILSSSAFARGENPRWADSPPVALKKGDLVFRRGQGFWTRYFVNVSTREKRFSHVAVVWRASSDGRRTILIHADADESSGLGRVHKDTWRNFFVSANALECAVFRFQGDEETAGRIADAAFSRLGIPFDAAFDLSETNRLYCTELAAESIKEATGTNYIATTVYNAREFVAIDDLYKEHFERIFDSARAYSGPGKSQTTGEPE